MKIVYSGQLLAAKPELTDRWHALIEEYRRDMENILSRAFLISESEWRENVTVMILIDRKRDEVGRHGARADAGRDRLATRRG